MSNTYYHGGPKGLRMILPSRFHSTRGQKHYGNHLVKEDRVYITTDPVAAAMYAAMHKKGSVYRVEPVGELVADPDCTLSGLSYECEKAKVLKETRLKPSEIKLIRAALAAAG